MRFIGRRRDFALMLLPGARYHLQELSANPKQLISWSYLGRTYEVDRQKEFKLTGCWHPLEREMFFSDLLVNDGIARSLMIFPTPPEVDFGPLHPLDRLSEIGLVTQKTDLTPQIHRAYFVSRLYRNRMRRLRIGGLNVWLILIALGIVGGVILLLYLSGYLGG